MQPTIEATPPAIEAPATLSETTTEPTPSSPSGDILSEEGLTTLEAAELPDWLRTMQPTTEAPSAPAVETTKSEPAISEPPAKPVEPAPTPKKEEATVGLPAWLAELQTSVQTSKPAAQTPTRTEPAAPTPPAPIMQPVQPPRAPREAIAYFDDSSAPVSVEKQETPTGEAEHQARLDLARVMKEMDLDSALELYAMLADAPEVVRQQAWADLAPYAPSHPRVADILTMLHVSGVAPVEAAVETEPPPTLSPALIAEPPPTMPPPEPVRVPREATAYFDDSSAPASVEKHAAPTGDAAYQARLDLARTLREVDANEAAEQYRSLVEGGVMLPQVIGDLLPIAQSQPKVPPLRALLVEALIRAGRALEAIPYLH
jgi:hypothetical protein